MSLWKLSLPQAPACAFRRESTSQTAASDVGNSGYARQPVLTDDEWSLRRNAVRHIAAKDRTFKTNRPNQGTPCENGPAQMSGTQKTYPINPAR